MEVLPVDLNAIVGIVMGMLVVLIPITGFTARFALKPIAEAIARMREGASDKTVIQMLERRIALLEQEVHGIEPMREELARLVEAVEFQRQLEQPKQHS